MTANELIVSALRKETVAWPAGTDALETLTLTAAQDHGVAALLATTPGIQSWPGRVKTSLTQSLRGEAAAEAIRRQALLRLLTALNDAGVEPLLLKGAQMAYTYYPSPWLRPRLDTDLMIAESDRTAADKVLGMLGYRPTTHFAGELVSHQFQYERSDRFGLSDHVDLHWKITNPHVFADAFSFEDLAAQAVPIPALGPNARGLPPAHALILACVHRVAHHRNSDRLIWLYDIHLLASGMDAADWGVFVEAVSAKHLAAVCIEGISLARVCFNTPIPSEWLERTGATDPALEPTAAFIGKHFTKLDVLRSDLETLHGWRPKLKIIREHLFPPVAYMRHAYGISNPAFVPLMYAFRIAKGVGKWSRRS